MLGPCARPWAWLRVSSVYGDRIALSKTPTGHPVNAKCASATLIQSNQQPVRFLHACSLGRRRRLRQQACARSPEPIWAFAFCSLIQTLHTMQLRPGVLVCCCRNRSIELRHPNRIRATVPAGCMPRCLLRSSLDQSLPHIIREIQNQSTDEERRTHPLNPNPTQPNPQPQLQPTGCGAAAEVGRPSRPSAGRTGRGAPRQRAGPPAGAPRRARASWW